MPNGFRQRNYFPKPPPFAGLVTAYRADGRRASTTHRYGQTMVNLSLKSEVLMPQGATGRVIFTASILTGGADVDIDTAWLTTQAEALGLVDVRPYASPNGVAVAGRIPAEEQSA